MVGWARWLVWRWGCSGYAYGYRWKGVPASRGAHEIDLPRKCCSLDPPGPFLLLLSCVQFQQKLIHEMERYQELADSKEALAARWAF